MDTLEITFADENKLSCRGTIANTDGGSLRSNDDGTFTEIRDSVQFYIDEGTICHESAGKMELKPGLYLINKDGLWLHI